MSKADHEAKAAPDLDTLADDIAALKRDFTNLASHFKAETLDSASAAARQAATRLTDQVERQPLLSLAAAFGIGFVVSRLFSR
jgi:ElaB/YqjD/DUF883 family membrane-anchored ribosome-binding protein